MDIISSSWLKLALCQIREVKIMSKKIIVEGHSTLK